LVSDWVNTVAVDDQDDYGPPGQAVLQAEPDNAPLNPTLETNAYVSPTAGSQSWDIGAYLVSNNHLYTVWELDTGACSAVDWAGGWNDKDYSGLLAHTFSGLVEATTYCWRATFGNTSGDGTVSATDEFTTQGSGGGCAANQHEGADDLAYLYDADAGWTVDALIGGTVSNTTDGSSCTITDNDETTVTCTLAGGTDNNWDTCDDYTIVMTGDYYVRPSGGTYGSEDGADYDNAWDGFSNVNWATVDSGDGRLFVCGTHNESVTIGAAGESGTPIHLVTCTTAKGSTDNDPGTIDPNAAGAGIYALDKAYIKIEGLTVTNSNPDKYSNGISIKGDSEYAHILENTVHGHGESGIELSCDAAGCTKYPDNGIIEYNDVYNNGTQADDAGPSGISLYKTGSDVYVRYNRIYSNNRNISAVDGQGLMLDFCDQGDVYAYGNLIYDNAGMGISITWNTNVSGVNYYIYNNTLYKNTQDAGESFPAEIQFSQSVAVANNPNMYIKNNIIWRDTGAINVANWWSGTKPSTWNYDYNDFVVTSGDFVRDENGAHTWAWWQATEGMDANSITADPLFTTAGSDFTLTATSPAIDVGVEFGSPYHLMLDPDSSWTSNVTTLDQGEQGLGPELGAFIYEEIEVPGGGTGVIIVGTSGGTITVGTSGGTITVHP
jgi:hypothetical protein